MLHIIIILQQKTRCRHSRFSNGCINKSINVSVDIFEIRFFQQTLEADLLVCMPALGGRIKVENDEIEKAFRAYMLANPTSSKKSQNVKSTTKNNDGFRRALAQGVSDPKLLNKKKTRRTTTKITKTTRTFAIAATSCCCCLCCCNCCFIVEKCACEGGCQRASWPGHREQFSLGGYFLFDISLVITVVLNHI